MPDFYDKVARIFDEVMLRAGIIRGSSQYTRFVILGDARCGSTFMMNLLQSHSNVVCFSEVFHRNRIFWATNIYSFFIKHPVLITQRDSDPQRFLARCIFREYSKNIRAVGFKLKYNDILRGQALLLENIIERYPNIHIIHLRRNNILEGIIARFISNLTQAMSEVDKQVLHEKLRAVLPFELEYEECLHRFNKLSARREAVNAKLRQIDGRIIEVDYTSLSNDTDAAMARILSALSIPPERLFTNQVKQEPDRMGYSISNYEELKAAFQDTEWSRFFTE